MKNNPIKEAINLFGSQSALARKIGVQQPTIFKWLKNGVVPPNKVLFVEKLTGISRCRLNPQIYPEQ